MNYTRKLFLLNKKLKHYNMNYKMKAVAQINIINKFKANVQNVLLQCL